MGIAALSGCGLPYEEPFFHPFDKVSGPAGTVYFVPATTLRACTWFECGESAHKTLGASLAALLLRRQTDGTLQLVSIARMECDEGPLADCDTVAAPPQLRRGAHGPVLENSARGAVGNTLAWQKMRNFVLGDGVWLCTASDLPRSENAQVLKVAPTPDFARVAQVLYALANTPQGDEAARCSDTATLPRPAGAPANLYLADAVRDEAGRLHVAYLAKEHEMAFDPVATLIAVDNDGWQMEQIADAARGQQPSPLNMPGFLDASAQQVVLDAVYASIENTADFTVFDRSAAAASRARLRWTERD